MCCHLVADRQVFCFVLRSCAQGRTSLFDSEYHLPLKLQRLSSLKMECGCLRQTVPAMNPSSLGRFILFDALAMTRSAERARKSEMTACTHTENNVQILQITFNLCNISFRVADHPELIRCVGWHSTQPNVLRGNSLHPLTCLGRIHRVYTAVLWRTVSGLNLGA